MRMRGLGLCGTDLAVYSGARIPPTGSWLMGHEGVGEIVAVGSQVHDRAVGDQVAIEPNYCCGRCRACRAELTSSCQNRVVVGLNHPGLLAEYVSVPGRFTWPAPPSIGIEDLVCVEPLTVARAAIRRGSAASTSRCLVVGAGSQGLLMVLALRAMGARVYVQEPHDGRAELALALGARAAAELGDAEIDVLFETSGVPQALGAGLEHLAAGGTAVLVGISSRPVDLTTAALVYRQHTLLGSLIYDHPVDFPSTIRALARDEIRPGVVLQARYPFREAAEAFASVAEVPGKAWISFDD
nr:alcohol dehydrogenase catalytic domain-containing protein [Geodermatophilus ruber]